jgi:hypothetical protein
MAKKNNTAEKTILDAEKITKALKEGTEKQLQSILNETISNLIKEDEDIEEIEDEVVADDGYEVEDVETEETSIDDKTPEVEEVEGGEEAEVEDTEDAEDEWSDFEEYKVGDNDYDFTGVDGETALKVYNKLNDDDEIFVTKDEEGNYEFKDEETGAEYVIELDADGNDEEAEVEDDLDLDVEGDEEEEGFEIELDDEEDDDNFGDEEEEESFEIELDDEEDDDELLSEENLGYTDSYQKDVFAKKPNMTEPAKGMNDWDEGAPKGAEKPWAGKGNMKPFGEKKQELDENGNGLNAKHSMKKTQNRLNKDAQGQHVASEEGEYKGTLSEDKARKIINAAKAIQAENKLYKESIEKIKKSLYEAAVLNVNLGKVVNLLVNETTTRDEKKSILSRFNEVKTISEGTTLFNNIKRELNETKKSAITLDKSIVAESKNNLNETTFYQDRSKNPSLALMDRLDNLWKK